MSLQRRCVDGWETIFWTLQVMKKQMSSNRGGDDDDDDDDDDDGDHNHN
jgi:hypothetical protein